MKNAPLLRASCLVCLCVALAMLSVAPERPRTAFAGRVVAAAPGVDRSRGPVGEEPVLPEGAAPDWWTAVRSQIEQETYAVRPATKAAPGTFEADNPAQRWQARFAPSGMAITPVASRPATRGPRVRVRRSTPPRMTGRSAFAWRPTGPATPSRRCRPWRRGQRARGWSSGMASPMRARRR